MSDSINDRFERLATQFYRETHVVAPGKDIAAAEGDGLGHKARVRIWTDWLNRYRKCLYCEFFDGGGLRRVELARTSGEVLHGDCLNRSSPHFQTTSVGSCDRFTRDSGLGSKKQVDEVDEVGEIGTG